MTFGSLSHVAFLVTSAEAAAATLSNMGYESGPVETWPGEGTKEIYFGDKHRAGRLLLMEPMADGAYRRAMSKRGPGLHHIGVDVTDLESYIDGLAGSGWYLHPKSLATMRKTKTAWLARPGVQSLVEVQQVEHETKEPNPLFFISKLEVSVHSPKPSLLASLGLKNCLGLCDDGICLTIDGRRFGAGEFM